MTNEPTTKTCTRCGKTFTGTIYLCAECEAELEKHEGEYGVKFNEPTTEEIVRALGNPETLDQESLYYWSKVAADRLESQEREIETLRAFHERYADQTSKKYIDDICALTDRAEQAERERDAAIGHVQDAIFGTNHSCFYCTMENCDGCTNSTVKEHFKYRGMHPNKYLVKQEYEQDGGAE